MERDIFILLGKYLSSSFSEITREYCIKIMDKKISYPEGLKKNTTIKNLVKQVDRLPRSRSAKSSLNFTFRSMCSTEEQQALTNLNKKFRAQ